MKIALLFILAAPLLAQQPQSPQPPDPNAPALTLDEKISLMTDDVKRQSALETAEKSYTEATKPIEEHQTETKAVIEKEHPGWILQNGPQGWHLVRRPDPPKLPEQPKQPEKKDGGKAGN